MRHRSSRPFLDRVLQRPTAATLRRGALAVSAVTVLGSAGAIGLTSFEGTAESDRPVATEEPPADVVTPVSTPSHDERPSRSSGRPGSTAPSPRPKATTPTTEPPAPVDTPDLPETPDVPRSQAPQPTRDPAPSTAHTTPPRPSDEDPPQTTAITRSAVDGVWTVVAHADEAATYTCSLDGATWQACSATTSLRGLALGEHTLLVRATDKSGNTDPTPAEVQLKVTGAVLH